jgi:DNA polymerase-3 subunit gamma/tau
MSEGLALKYRPEYFEDMIGQNLVAVVLQKFVDADDVPHGLLFSGPSGTGKTSAARILAAEMNPNQRESIVEGISPDVLEIDAASNGGVGEIRKLLESLRYQPSPGAKRVVIVDECHSVTREGFNALLKPTEEESGTTFVFVTTEPEKIPVTVLSRLIEFEFYRVTPSEIFNRLVAVSQQENTTTDTKLLQLIAMQAQGNVRSALNSLNLVLKAQISSVEEYTKLRGDHDYGPRLLEKMATGNHNLIFEELDAVLMKTGSPEQVSSSVTHTLKDLLVLRSGGTLTYSGQALLLRKDLALQLEAERIFAAIKLLWDLKTRVRGSQNGTVDLETSLILVADVLSRGKTSPPSTSNVAILPPQPAPEPTTTPDSSDEDSRPLTLADLQRLQ